MLKEVAPKLAHVALIGNPKATPFDYFQQAAAATAPSLGIELASRRVETAAEITHAVESVAQASNGVLIFQSDTTIILHRDLVVALAAQYRLPAVYPFRAFVDAGGEEVPGLTCHEANWHGMGRTAVQVLLRALADPEGHTPEHHLSPHILRTGRTTAAPNQP